MTRNFPRLDRFVPLSRTSHLVGVSMVLLAFSLATGCGPATGNVAGKVYYNDKVVTSGFVTLVGTDGIPKNCPIGEDGSYKIDGVVAGEAKVAIRSLNPAETRGGRK